jgi:hypothetical protein
MNEQFTRLPLFRIRLSETVAWCAPQPVESNPAESDEIKERRRQGAEAGRLTQRAFLSNGPNFWQSHLYRRARRLFEKARLYSIVPLARQLRSPVLQPESAKFPQDPLERVQAVETLAEKRAGQLRTERRYPTTECSDLAGGRLLLYRPNENLFDGAAQYASKGFFDVDNIPPWDTWICFFERQLVSWVPPKLLELANQGIDANPEGCIAWAPETGLPNA